MRISTLSLIAIATMLAAIVTLYLMRDEDTFLAVHK